MDLSIIIPCFNESDSLALTERELGPAVTDLSRDRDVEVIFVDDGSSDDTWSVLQSTFTPWNRPRLAVRFERHQTNHGVGAAQRTGFAAARGTTVVTSDCDATYKFTEIAPMLERLNAGADIVTASPYHPEGGVAGVPRHRLVLSRGASTLYRLLADGKIHTYTCMFRAYRRQVIEQVKFSSNGFLSSAEILVNAIHKGFRVVEYPAVLHTREVGTSKARLVRIMREHLKFQGTLILRRLGLASWP